MESNAFRSAHWYNAVTLKERADVLSQAFLEQLSATDHETGRELVEKWRRQDPFSRGSYFAQRLALAGLTESQFMALVDTPVEAFKYGVTQPPLWLVALARVFDSCEDCARDAAPQLLTTSEFFVDPCQSFIHDGRRRLLQGIRLVIERFRVAPFDECTITDLLQVILAGGLADMIGRTLTLELHVARLLDRLDGDTPEERFRSFQEHLMQPAEALNLLREYPVLARQLVLAVERWLAFSLELLERLCADWADIRETLAQGRDPGHVVSWRGAGDDHRGRHVVILEFSSGLQIVYKPRCLALDRHFQQFLGWLNTRGQDPPFRTLHIIERNGYGWVEFVSPGNCEHESEVRRFYERQGSNLAVLYLLHATDFHHENLIAAGEHPVLIDLETLFHQSPDQPGDRAVHAAVVAMSTSVLGVGLLPHRSGATEESEGIDLSGLGTAEGQPTPFTIPLLEDVGTDQMRWTRKHVTLPAVNNRPLLGGAALDVRNYAQAVEAGFSTTYRLLLRYRDDLLADDGPLARFSCDELRIVLRATHTYAVLLRESFHPDVLRDALERDRLFDRLWVPVEHQPYLSKVIPAECRDLANGDIPIFHTRPDSRDLWLANGDQVPEFFNETGMTIVKRRLLECSTADLARQLWFIRASFASLDTQVEGGWTQSVHVERAPRLADGHELLGAARAVGDRLRALAVRSSDQATWIGLTLGPRNRWTITPLTIGLYDGLPGIVLFLAYLGHISRDNSYTALARAGLASLRHQVELYRPFKGIGGFTGWGGVVYTFSVLGTLWKDPQLLDEAAALVDVIAPLVEHDDQLDILSGAAGCLASLISLHHVAPSQQSLTVAVQCGDYLRARASRMPAGIGWRVPGQPRPLTGFSHGAAGIGWALLNLADLTGDERYRETASAAIAYERSLFSREAGNWLDVRVDDRARGQHPGDGEGFMTAWCHGASGIGLARLLSLGRLDDRELETEVRIALHTTLEEGFGQNHGLCHGDLGNLDFFLQAGDVLDDPGLRRDAYHKAAAVLDEITTHGWRCGLSTDVETPGLMTGLAGIGYQFLRLVDPMRVPSVLCLAPARWL